MLIPGSSNEDYDTIFFWRPFSQLTSTKAKNWTHGRIGTVFQELFYTTAL